MNVKAQGLLNAVKWVEDEYGTSALREIIRACSPAVRERYVSAIAINWHPLEELDEFLGVADKVLGQGDGRIAEQIGAAGARANMKGVVIRFAFYVSRPEFLMKRVAGLWKQFNDQGMMRLLDVSASSLRIEVVDVPVPSWLFCCTITGWSREVALAVAMAHPTARHIECRARGGARCIWEVRGRTSSPAGTDSGGAPSSSQLRVPKT